jgi:hypothetical protein
MPPSYGQLPVKALEAQRSDLIAAIGRIETAWGRRPKDGAAVLDLTRLQQSLTDTESQIRRLAGAPNIEAVASTASTTAATAATTTARRRVPQCARHRRRAPVPRRRHRRRPLASSQRRSR